MHPVDCIAQGIVNKFSTGFATLVINNYKFHSASREACWKPRSLTSGQNTDPIVWCNVWFDLHRAGIKKVPSMSAYDRGRLAID